MITNSLLESITISSRFGDYDVSFIDDFKSHIMSHEQMTVFIVDSNVYRLYSSSFSEVPSDRVYLIDATEESKQINTVLDCIDFFFQTGVHKDWLVCAIGGGITQDIATLVCSLYLRNVNWIYYPTTLLSMSDSCIGGKSGINYKNKKNQLGVFYPPSHIYIDTGFILTLTNDDYLNGWGELVKFSLTDSCNFFEMVKNEESYIPCDNIVKYLHMGLLVKKSKIEEDEFDTGARRLLNYGHTFGHALEAYSDNAISHGKGVLWGMDVANFISYKLGIIDLDYYLEVKSLICRRLLKFEIKVEDSRKLFEILKTDKKVKGNSLNFALLTGRSSLSIRLLELDENLYSLFTEFLEYNHNYFQN